MVVVILGIILHLQCPPILEEHESLRSHDGAASALTAEFLVDLGLDASTPDTYRAPPAPLPYDLVLGYPQSTESESARETSMMLKIQILSRDVNTTFTSHAFLNGWKEVMHAQYVIRK
ncbi:putative e3 ubiquitin-protein ligase rhb1a [Quercus suber]|uniref:E3 ubiquitin-protein ligase rhb1a n=1 Tax=Quercus suber TaxID=58331 RepID=A0AAW0M9X4_QUESU